MYTRNLIPKFNTSFSAIKNPLWIYKHLHIKSKRYLGSDFLLRIQKYAFKVKDSTKNIKSFKLIHQTKSVSKIYVFIIYLCFCLFLISMHHLIPSSYLHYRLNLYQKRFYNRETNSPAFFVLQQMSINFLFSFMQLK